METIIEKLREPRERSKNFTCKERDTAITIIKKYRDVLEDKGTSHASIQQRKRAWELVTQEFNNTKHVTLTRTADQLKVLWFNSRRATRRGHATKSPKKPHQESLVNGHDEEILNKNQINDKNESSNIGGGENQLQGSDVRVRILPVLPMPMLAPLTMKDGTSISMDPLTPEGNFEIKLEPEDEFIMDNENSLDFDGSVGYSDDKDIAEKRRTILHLEKQIKERKLEIVNQQFEYDERLFEMNLRIKEKELEAKCDEVHFKRQLYELELSQKKDS